MSVLGPYKRKGGFIRLLKLYEESHPSQKERILSLVEKESSAWAKALQQYSIRPEDFLVFDDLLWEKWWKIVGSERWVWAGFSALAPEIAQKIQQNWPSILKEAVKRVSDSNESLPPSEKQAGFIRWVQALRKMIEDDPSLRSGGPEHWSIPEDIESRLMDMPVGSPVSVSSVQNEKSPGVEMAPGEDQWVSERNKLIQMIQHLQNENNSLRLQIRELTEKLHQIRKLAS